MSDIEKLKRMYRTAVAVHPACVSGKTEAEFVAALVAIKAKYTAKADGNG